MVIFLPIFVAFLVLQTCLGQQFDPIAQQLCNKYGYTSPHSLCLPSAPYFLKMETSSPDEILSLHNFWRDQVVDGVDPLPKYTWDNDLAVLAERWAAQCPGDHDAAEQRKLPRVNWIGQNQCFSSGYEVSWSDCINAWAGERAFFKHGVGSTNGSDVGHYTQIIWQNTKAIGCAKAHCRNVEWEYVLVCNYGPGGNIGRIGENHFSKPYVLDPAKVGRVSNGTLPIGGGISIGPTSNPGSSTQQGGVLSDSTPRTGQSSSYMTPGESNNTQSAPLPANSTTAATPAGGATGGDVVPPSGHRGPQCKYGLTLPNALCLPDSAELIELDLPAPQKIILVTHNSLRSSVSPPPKTPIPNLSWDNDLAIAAERVAAQCSGEHYLNDLSLPSRGNIPEFKYVNQNICAKSGAPMSWEECLGEWSKESANWRYGTGKSDPNSKIGHFTQMIWANTTLIGCGKAHCSSAKFEYVLVCHYAPGGNIGPTEVEQFGKPYEIA